MNRRAVAAFARRFREPLERGGFAALERFDWYEGFFGLGFEMGCGHANEEAYGPRLCDSRDAERGSSGMDYIAVLGSAIFSQFRFPMHSGRVGAWSGRPPDSSPRCASSRSLRATRPAWRPPTASRTLRRRPSGASAGDPRGATTRPSVLRTSLDSVARCRAGGQDWRRRTPLNAPLSQLLLSRVVLWRYWPRGSGCDSCE